MNADGLLFIACIAGLFLIFYGPWQWICTDFARQIIFEERDAIFDMAARGEIDFRSREYQDIRDSLNYLIRFCHDLTLPNLLYFKFTAASNEKKEDHSTVFVTIKSISDVKLRQKFEAHVFKAYICVIAMIAAKSLIFPIAIMLAIFAIILHFCASKISDYLKEVLFIFGDSIQIKAEYTMSPFKPYGRK
jgi:hypothetical protein